jgi:hypothetical protein
LLEKSLLNFYAPENQILFLQKIRKFLRRKKPGVFCGNIPPFLLHKKSPLQYTAGIFPEKVCF